MKTFLFFLLFGYGLNSLAQDSCVVKVFPNDCVNCYLGMTAIKSAPEKIHKTIVFPKMTDAEVKAYLKDVFNISDVENYTIIVSDSVYKSLSKNISSEVYVYDKNKLRSHSLLKNLHSVDKQDKFSNKIPDSIAISNTATLINNPNYFFITDPTFANCIFIDKHGNHSIRVVKAKSLTTKANFNKLSGDTLSFYMFLKYREPLAGANMDRMKFESTFDKKNMSSFILTPNIKEDENSNAGLTYKYGLIIFIAPDGYKLLPIDETSLPYDYVVYPKFFTVHNGIYYIQITNTNRDSDDQYLLGKFSLINQKLVFSGFVNYKVPQEYLPAKKFKSLSKIMILAYPYVFLQYSLSFFDFEKNITSSLPLDSINLVFEFPNKLLNSLKLESDVKITDAYINDNVVEVLYKKKETYFIAYINRSDFSLIKTKEVFNSFKSVKAGIEFYSKNSLMYLTNDNTIVVESINGK